MYHVVDTKDEFILFSGTLDECVEVQETSYGGLTIFEDKDLPPNIERKQ